MRCKYCDKTLEEGDRTVAMYRGHVKEGNDGKTWDELDERSEIFHEDCYREK